jgi:hypothetical protein
MSWLNIIEKTLKKHREKRIHHWAPKTRVPRLQMTRQLLKETIKRQCSNSIVDVIKVCDNIVFVHISGAY